MTKATTVYQGRLQAELGQCKADLRAMLMCQCGAQARIEFYFLYKADVGHHISVGDVQVPGRFH